MATIKSDSTSLTITMDFPEFLRVVAGCVSPILRARLPQYEERFARCETVTVHAEDVKVVVQIAYK
jgi:hypothetical protein